MNFYFCKRSENSSDDATLSDFKVNGISVYIFSWATTFYTYELIVRTSLATTITAKTIQIATSLVVTQGTLVPGHE